VPVTDNRRNKAWCATGEVEILVKGTYNRETVDWQRWAGTENSLVRDTDYASVYSYKVQTITG